MNHYVNQQDDSRDVFSQRLLAWFDKYGRTELPWQHHPTAYHVWVSEIMLQQTQVNTVIPYYQQFIQRFPQIQVLAAASLDEVLHCWAGLGYYARARNLHKAAQYVCSEYGGELPSRLDELMSLPGIGRSTAGAILTLAYGQRHPILDGNVKRVLCRYHAVVGWPGEAKVAQALWHLAERHTPCQRVAAYTQAIMDLGALICIRRMPHCTQCPLNVNCVAHQQGEEMIYPTPKLRKTLPIKTTVFIMLQNQKGEVLLQKRPLQGVWGGLWSFPECPTVADVPAWCQHCLPHLSSVSLKYREWPPVRHTFTHFQLDIVPVHISSELCQTVALSDILWYNIAQPQVCGLAAPVTRLLAQLTLF